MRPDPAPIPYGMVRLTCDTCKRPTTVTATAWARTAPKMGCGNCRKVTTWTAS
jgi:hypothetical protein